MMVNGQARWTCRTHVKKVLRDGQLRIAPLRNLPVIKDLAADMDPFFDKWVKAGGVHPASRTRNDPISANTGLSVITECQRDLLVCALTN